MYQSFFCFLSFHAIHQTLVKLCCISGWFECRRLCHLLGLLSLPTAWHPFPNPTLIDTTPNLCRFLPLTIGERFPLSFQPSFRCGRSTFNCMHLLLFSATSFNARNHCKWVEISRGTRTSCVRSSSRRRSFRKLFLVRGPCELHGPFNE